MNMDEEGEWIDSTGRGKKTSIRRTSTPTRKGNNWKGWRDYDETKWVDQPRWATNSKKWRAREPDEEPNEKTDTTKPMETESNNDDGSTKDTTTNAKPNSRRTGRSSRRTRRAWRRG